jgi:hypothetical protein
MTKQISNLLTCAVCVGFLVAWSPNAGLAAEKANFSGRYSAHGQKAASGDKIDSSLEVVQTEDSIEITQVERGSKTSNRYSLNGSEGDCKSPSGVLGTCKAQFKDKYLVLESVFTATPQANGPPMRIHTKQRWQLSSDSKTLTVKSDVDFPDAPRDVSSAVGESMSGTLKYTRLENP